MICLCAEPVNKQMYNDNLCLSGAIALQMYGNKIEKEVSGNFNRLLNNREKKDHWNNLEYFPIIF